MKTSSKAYSLNLNNVLSDMVLMAETVGIYGSRIFNEYSIP